MKNNVTPNSGLWLTCGQVTTIIPMTGIEVATQGRGIQYKIHHIDYSSQSVWAEYVHLQCNTMY